MPLLLREATPTDAFSIGCIGRDAFRDTLSRSIFPPHLRHKSPTGDPALDEAQWRAARCERRMAEGKPTFVVVDVPEKDSNKEGEGDGVVVGFAQWESPSSGEGADSHHEMNEAGKEPSPGSLDVERLRELYGVMEDETKKVLGPDGYSKMWYLMGLAIDPAHQRRGIGKMLLKQGMEPAAKDGSDIFLLATEAGRGLYHSFGFREVGETISIVDVVHYPMLWKNPGPTSF